MFLGSGAFAIPSLEALVDTGHDVAAVVTQPDREKGRGRRLAPPPLKPVAQARGLRILQPRRVKEPEAQAALSELAPELQVVVAYGQILPQAVIDIPQRGTLNVHASLLPRYRGAAPVQWAIARGETRTGVTTMLIDAGLDTGPTLLSRATEIGEDERAPELEARLARIGAELLVETVEGLEHGTLVPEPQDPERATVAPLLRKSDGRADWSLSATALANRVRGFDPWPGVTGSYRGRGVRLLRVAPEPGAAGSTASPGSVLELRPDGVAVACGEGTQLRLIEVQPESRGPMSAAAFAAGARAKPGDRFE